MLLSGTPGNNPRAFPCIGRKRSRPRPPCAIKKNKVLGYAPPARAQSGRAKRGEWPALKWLARKRSNVSSAILSQFLSKSDSLCWA